MDYLNLHECYYAFLALQPLFFYPRKLIFLNEGELQALPREEQKICVSLPQVPTNVVHKDFFDFMHISSAAVLQGKMGYMDNIYTS